MTPSGTSSPNPNVIFVNDVKQDWTEDQVQARRIIERAGKSPPEQYLLEELDHQHGKSIRDYQPNETVNIGRPGVEFFRITPGGGGFS